MKRIPILMLMALLFAALASAHPITKFKFPSKAAKQLLAASKELEAYKSDLNKAGKYACCMKAPTGSRVDGCNMCGIQNGSCSCGANLAQGKGVCGECKGAWLNGKGGMNLKEMGIANAEAIPVLPSQHQSMADVKQDESNPHLKKYRELILSSKKVLVTEKRFNCCVGKGGCDECALEQYCGCAVNLNEDLKKKDGEKKEGICAQCLDGQHAGHGRIPGVDPNKVAVMSMDMNMKGAIGTDMSQEGSGTTWLPANSPMYMKNLGVFGGYDVNFMGLGTVNFADSGGKRGESQWFSNSMLMFMAQKEIGDDTLAFRFMGSLDPFADGKKGYPNLFQTGETAFGEPLKDRQHPHDLIMELAATYSKPLSENVRGFLYLAPVGEPALGTSAFQHRPSSWEMPEAPINHHWNDGTHISSGVVTAGVNIAETWKIDASLFTGREPDENRYDIDPIKLDSASGRITFNPTRNWSLSASYGFLNDPESLEPGVDVHRIVLSALHQRGNLSLGAIWARNIKHGENSDAFSLEGTYANAGGSLFARFEHVDKDELVDVPEGIYKINKFTLGGVRNFARSGGFEYGVGAYLALYSFPSSLNDYYGKNPVSFGIFLRVRPEKM